MPQEPNVAVEHRTFKVDLCLGRGGFGEVYRARLRQPGGLTTTVAIKVLIAGVSSQSQPVERLKDEGRILAQLEHPVIMRVIDITTLDNRVALVVEYIAGQDLSECCRGNNALSQAGLVHVIGEVASALDKAWSTPAENGQPLHLVHRDIKPTNIRIGKHGEVKLLDFGIARSDAMTREARTASQLVVGSLHYMAPERFSDRPLGPEADVFSLGCCLFEGLCGQRLFRRLPGPKVLALANDRHRYAEYLSQRKRALANDTHPLLVAMLDRCLAHRPKDRPTAAELVTLCDQAVSDVPGPALRSWARSRDWPAEGSKDGPLTGMTFDTMAKKLDNPGKSKLWLQAPETARPTPELLDELAPRPAPPRKSNNARLFAGAIIGLVTLGLTSLLALGGVTWIWTGVGSPTSVEQPADTEVDAPEPATPVDEPDAAPSPPPADTAPSPQPAPIPGDPVATPSPKPAQKPRVGTLVILGEQNVGLRGEMGQFGAGIVPVGAYVVWVDGGAGPQPSIRVQIVAEQALTLRCNGLLTSCTQESSSQPRGLEP